MTQRTACYALITVATFAVSVYLLVALATYGYYDGYFDHGEAIVAAAAYRMLDGAQVYPPFDGPNFTSNIYAPYLYLVNGLFLGLFGGHAWSGKAAGLVAAALTVFAVLFIFSGDGRRKAMLSVVLIVAYILLFMPFSIWNRPDPFLMLLSALAVLIAHEKIPLPRWGVWLLLGVIGGLACGLKIYGPLFIMPAGMFVALRHKSVVALAVMTLAGALVALAPFTLPVFSLESYLSWFSVVAAKPTSGELVTKALRYGVFFIAPAAFLLTQRFRARQSIGAFVSEPAAVYAALTLLGIILCVYLGSKPGAGMYYLLPFAPLAIDMALRSRSLVVPERRTRITLFCWGMAAAMLATSVPVQKRLYRALDWDRTGAIKSDLGGIMQRYPDKSIQMGVGDSIGGYHNTLQKTELIYAGHPYTVDFGVMIETSYLRIPVPQALIGNISECTTDIWLTPKGEAPLALVGYYGNRIADDNFRDAFLAAYGKTGSSAYFDIWTCRKNN